MPWHFRRTARTWRPADSTARSGCIVRRTASWKRASFRARWTGVRDDVHSAVPRVAVDGVDIDRFRVESRGAARDHRPAAARGAAGQALHADDCRQESRWRREGWLDDAGVVHAAD